MPHSPARGAVLVRHGKRDLMREIILPDMTTEQLVSGADAPHCGNVLVVIERDVCSTPCPKRRRTDDDAASVPVHSGEDDTFRPASKMSATGMTFATGELVTPLESWERPGGNRKRTIAYTAAAPSDETRATAQSEFVKGEDCPGGADPKRNSIQELSGTQSVRKRQFTARHPVKSGGVDAVVVSLWIGHMRPWQPKMHAESFTTPTAVNRILESWLMPGALNANSAEIDSDDIGRHFYIKRKGNGKDQGRLVA